MNRIARPIFLMIFPILIGLLVTSCGPRLKSENEANDYVDATVYQDSGRRMTFTGSVTALGEYGYSLTLLPDEDSKLPQKGEVRVTISDSVTLLDGEGNRIALADLNIGDRVRITYSGSVLISDPMRISQCYEVKKLE